MNIDELEQKLAALDVAVVKDFVLNLYLQYPELNTQIETLVLMNDPAAYKKAIAKRIAGISRGRKFIDYRMSGSFARNLDSIVLDIENGLLEVSPKHAFDLMTKFLATGNKVLERADDSSGEISGIYRDAVLMWLTAAKAWKGATAAGAKINWLERVYELYCDNDYSVYDTLLPNSAILLSQDELTQLAWRYESELRQALKASTKSADGISGFNMEALISSSALGSVAEALKDPTLYERAIIIHSPEPNDLQKKSLIGMYLQFKQPEEALRWLNTPWQKRFESDRLHLLEKVHLQKGDTEELKQTRYQCFVRDKSYLSFTRYLDCVSDKEKEKAKLEAIKFAEQAGQQGDYFSVNVDLLLRLNEAERAQVLVLSNPKTLACVFYESLLKLAKQFEEQQCWLAATACYRSLLLDILKQARSKAYTHAARYYKKLVSISTHIEQYSPLADHKTFIQQLNEKHGRKTSFWQRVL